MRSRLVAAAATVGTVLLAASSLAAAPKPQVVDAKGDAKGAQRGTDIHSVLFARTTGGFTVTLTLDGPPVRQPGVLYRVYGNQSECGTFQMSSAATVSLVEQNQVYMTCGTEPSTTGDGTFTIVNVSPKTVGSSLVWSFKTKMLPKEMRSGVMSELEAVVTLADPVFGILNAADFLPASAVDHAAGDGTFRY